MAIGAGASRLYGGMVAAVGCLAALLAIGVFALSGGGASNSVSGAQSRANLSRQFGRMPLN
ncbi:MAG: hypothetical protein M3065_04910, partial [Actinomycetota bacterium]|nr:hypothetical protein [Actinomycetota bacterium]